MAQERKAAQEPAAKQKKIKAQNGIVVDESHVPTAEELRRRQMRAGRFGKGAVDHSMPGRAHAPVFAVRVISFWLLCSCTHHISVELCLCLFCLRVGTTKKIIFSTKFSHILTNLSEQFPSCPLR